MPDYSEVTIAQPPGTETFKVTPNPCPLSPAGIRFSNSTKSNATVDMTGVPGFEKVGKLVVPAGGKKIAERDSSTGTPGDHHYSVKVANLAPSTPADASPRVILDVLSK